jgi:cell wall assembly regulator SMI1
MDALWRRLEAQITRLNPALLASLNPPATKEAIRLAETKLRVQFPADFAASLRVHDGQVKDSLLVGPQYGKRGGRRREVLDSSGLLALSEIVRMNLALRKNVSDGAISAEDAESFEFDGPVRRDGDWSWIVIGECASGDSPGLDLRPADGGHVGQVLAIIHDPPGLFVLAPSFRAWFEKMVEEWEALPAPVADQDTVRPKPRTKGKRGGSRGRK